MPRIFPFGLNFPHPKSFLRPPQQGAGSGQHGAGAGQQTGSGAGSGQQTGTGAGSGQQTGSGAGSGQQTGAGAGSGQHGAGAGQHWALRLQHLLNRPASAWLVEKAKHAIIANGKRNLFIEISKMSKCKRGLNFPLVGNLLGKIESVN